MKTETKIFYRKVLKGLILLPFVLVAIPVGILIAIGRGIYWLVFEWDPDE